MTCQSEQNKSVKSYCLYLDMSDGLARCLEISTKVDVGKNIMK